MNTGNRTRHYRILAGHFRLWAEGETSSEVTKELRDIATRLDQLAANAETTRVPRTSYVDRAESLAR